MSSLLITGGAGFIGGNFVHYWAERYPDDTLIVLDALTYAGNRSTIADVEQAQLVEGDIRDTALVEQLLRDRDISTVVHFAAESHVDRSITGPDAFIDTNILGTNSLLKAARTVWLDQGSGRDHRFHHISTDEVFGSLGPDEPPLARPPPTLQIRPIPHQRLHQITWSELITTHSASRSLPVIVRTITGHINTQKN